MTDSHHPETTEAALNVLAVWSERREAYHKTNAELRALQGDFASSICEIDEKLCSAVLRLLDSVFGDDSASYFLFECEGLKLMGEAGGSVQIGDKVWPIRSIDDLRTYLKERPNG